MKRTFSKKHWTSLGNYFVVALAALIACADGWWPDYGSSSFTPEAFVDRKYTPFFYSELFYYKINFDTNHDRRFNTINQTEWHSYLDGRYAKGEIDFLLLKATEKDIQSALNGKIPKALANSIIIKNRHQTKESNFLNYLVLAKQAEEFTLNYLEDEWDYESYTSYVQPATDKPIDPTGKLEKDLVAGLNKASDEFMKQRYLFQLVRYYFFKNQYDKAIDTFNANSKGLSQNNMYFRTLGYVAGSFYKKKNYSFANYLYSLVFAASDPLKVPAHFSFRPQEESDWQKTLAYAKNAEEKINLWLIIGLSYKDELRSMEEIYKLNPKHQGLDVLITRAINKQEYRLTYLDYDDYGKPIKNKAVVDKNLVLFTKKIADENKVSNPVLWNSALGYLYFLSKDYTSADTYFAKAEKDANTPISKAQIRLLKLLNAVGKVEKITPDWENNWLKDLDWIASMNGKEFEDFRFEYPWRWIRETMSEKYRKQGELVKAECYQQSSKFYANDKNVDVFIAFFDRKNHTPYEQFLVKISPVKYPDLVEFKTYKLLLDGKINEAQALLSTSKKASDKALLANPFNGRIKDCHDCEHAEKQKVKYTRKLMLDKMVEMNQKILQKEDIFNNALLIGNAFYNISHYGNARYFFEGQIIGSHYAPYAFDETFYPLITTMKKAREYYQLALENAINDEQKAKAHYMLAKCERNDWYTNHIFTLSADIIEYEPRKVHFLAWQGFKELKKLSHTQYYKDVIKECGYFNTYINGKNRESSRKRR